MAPATETEPMITLESPVRPIRRLTPKEAALRMLHDLAQSSEATAY